MKIQIELDPAIDEDLIVIKCRSVNEQILSIEQALSDVIASKEKFIFYQGEKECYIPLDEILFFETNERMIHAHSKDQIYQVKYRLYELEDLLPSYFVRVAKSTIVNINHIRAINRNLTGASELEFAGSKKTIFVSRSYFKLLKEKLDERRSKR